MVGPLLLASHQLGRRSLSNFSRMEMHKIGLNLAGKHLFQRPGVVHGRRFFSKKDTPGSVGIFWNMRQVPWFLQSNEDETTGLQTGQQNQQPAAQDGSETVASVTGKQYLLGPIMDRIKKFANGYGTIYRCSAAAPDNVWLAQSSLQHVEGFSVPKAIPEGPEKVVNKFALLFEEKGTGSLMYLYRSIGVACKREDENEHAVDNILTWCGKRIRKFNPLLVIYISDDYESRDFHRLLEFCNSRKKVTIALVVRDEEEAQRCASFADLTYVLETDQIQAWNQNGKDATDRILRTMQLRHNKKVT